MPTHVVLAHSDIVFLRSCEFALSNAGCFVEALDNSMSALNRLEQSEHFDVLVTRTQFPKGQPNGLSIALIAKQKKLGVKIVVTSVPELAEYTEGLGIVLQAPVSPAEVVKAVRQAMADSL
jgi:DNA-binding NtrC family response regulator